MDLRVEQATTWLVKHLNNQPFTIKVLAGDASFRRYFRVTSNGRSYALMDAPPRQEDSAPFVALGHSWKNQGVAVPHIFAEDLNAGFLLLEDFGDVTFFKGLQNGGLKNEPDRLYQQAIEALIPIQHAPPPENYSLPAYDEGLLRREISLFTDWLLAQKLALQPNGQEQQVLDKFFDALVMNALHQPAVVVHRDYHSRNLMIKKDKTLGILDYQDAVMGPLTYDLVSLLRDCYIKWPYEKVGQWINIYLEQLKLQQGIDYRKNDFIRWFDLMGMQRHLKASGIFARLSLRDGKHTYLKDIPRTVSYLVDISALYREFNEVHHWLTDVLTPALASLAADHPDQSKQETTP